MAHFYNLNNNWINIDNIVSMYYDPEVDCTYIFSTDSPEEHFATKGDVINQILNANNDLTMHEKHFANCVSDKFKSVLASILARLDNMSKNIEETQKDIASIRKDIGKK